MVHCLKITLLGPYRFLSGRWKYLSHSLYFLEPVAVYSSLWGIIPKDHIEHEDEASWRWRGWKPKSAGVSAGLMLLTTIVWFESLPALLNAMFSHQERNLIFAPAASLLEGRGEALGDLWLKQLTQQSNRVKLFPVGKVFWIVLPHSFSWFPTFGPLY